MAYQFVHMELYSRKADKGGRSVGWVLSEAAREPGSCPHVTEPTRPEIVFGVDLGEVRRRHDEACDVAKVVLANGKERALRKDQKTLMTVVASHPAEMGQARADPKIAADVQAWEARTVAWLQAQYGLGLLSVVRHVDESHPHVHAYILPADHRAARLHPGAEAKRLITAAGPTDGEDAKALNRRGDAAYKQAMREWQDSYHQKVGIPSGLARLGPGRRRLTRDEWQAEKAAASATKTAIDRAAHVDARARKHIAAVKSAAAVVVSAAREKTAAAEQQAAAAKALHEAAVAREHEAAQTLARAGRQANEATALHEAAEAREWQATAAIDRAGREAERIVAQAESRASRISSWGGRLRALWDGLRRSSIVEAARRAAAAAVERERVRADATSRRLLEETSRRQEAERRARMATESVRVTAAERDRARQELAALRPVAPAAGVTMGMRR